MSNYNSNENRNPLYSYSGRIVGWIEADVFCKNAIASRLMLKIPRGWAWDVFVLERARSKGLIRTIIYEKEHDLVYQANLEDFWLHGVSLNRGYGEQICLPLKYWQVSEKSTPFVHQLSLHL